MTTETTTTETAPAVDTGSDDALIALLESGGDEEAPAEAAPAEPAPAPETAPPPAEDPIAAIEARRAEVLAERQRKEAEAQQARAKSETETAAERARAEAEADRRLLLTDPLAFADKHGLDKKALLERLVKDGSNPAAAELRRAQAEAESKIAQENAELRRELEAIKADTSSFRQQVVYQQDLGMVQSMATPDAFPILARTDPHERLAEIYKVRSEYEGVDLGPDPVRTLLTITERSMRQRAERYASLLAAGQTPGATTQNLASGASGTTSSGQPASRTITNELAAAPAGKRPPPQSDEEREAEALRILGG
jgi:hypothetical protein